MSLSKHFVTQAIQNTSNTAKKTIPFTNWDYAHTQKNHTQNVKVPSAPQLELSSLLSRYFPILPFILSALTFFVAINTFTFFHSYCQFISSGVTASGI